MVLLLCADFFLKIISGTLLRASNGLDADLDRHFPVSKLFARIIISCQKRLLAWKKFMFVLFSLIDVFRQQLDHWLDK